MALLEVLLLKPVENLGAEGDQVKVRAGFARNFLLPQKIALPVSQANRKHIEHLQKARTQREARELEVAQAEVGKLTDVKLVFAVKTGEGGKMFGAVTAADVAAKLAENGIEIDRKKVHLPHGSVKGLGVHIAHVKLHNTITHELEFEVISENPIEEPKEEPEETGKRKGKKRPYRKDADAETAPDAPAPAAESVPAEPAAAPEATVAAATAAA
ncbi:MAG: 50S ribosomal protein L9 [Puniceicoccales bacterium]|jgi:large subunit ribosomal protein L9|nr:50S ribosomal protein L9 [Puniceicoccales bacterium]